MTISRPQYLYLVLGFALAACTLPTTPPAEMPTATRPEEETAIPLPPSGSPSEEPALSLCLLSGRVDMRSAPPYLNDPIVYAGVGMPVTVGAMNQSDGQWYWLDTTPTHPLFELIVPPGTYVIVAFARGVADVPYVTGAYTGENPSCGLPDLPVTVNPGETVEEIEIADWNWSCGGTAERPDKPESIPVP